MVHLMADYPFHHGLAYCRILCDMVSPAQSFQCLHRGMYTVGRPTREGLQTAADLLVEHGTSEADMLVSTEHCTVQLMDVHKVSFV